jgi:HEAT repeat protein
MRYALLLTLLAAPVSAIAPQIIVRPPTSSELSDVLGRANLAASRFVDLNGAYDVAVASYADAQWNFPDFAASRDLSEALVYSSFATVQHVPRSAWAPDDPADSLYRLARETLTRGDYRKAAQYFEELGKTFPTSIYARDVPYWQAFSLYRIGSTPELQRALSILDRWRSQQPATGNAKGSAPVLVRRDAAATERYVVWSNSTRPDGDALAARIAGVLSTRGMANDPAVKRALTARGADACDQEEQAVRSEALNALMRSDPEGARSVAIRVLAKKDECSVPLRRVALFQLAEKRDASATAIVIDVAKNDPATPLRVQAIDWLGQLSTDQSVTVLEALLRSEESAIQRASASALARHQNPRAKNSVRAMIEQNGSDEAMRMAMLDGFGGDRMNAEDAAWLRAAYPRITSSRVQGRLAQVLADAGGEANMQWLTALARNEDTAIEARIAATRAVARKADVATLSALYDGATDQRLRTTVLYALAERRESGAVEKLIDIARNGTDPGARRAAISALASSKDPRASKLLLELVDK